MKEAGLTCMAYTGVFLRRNFVPPRSPSMPGSLHERSWLNMYGIQEFFASELRSPTESSRCVGISAMTFLDAPLVAVVVDPSSTGALLAREVHQRGPLRG